MSEAFVPVDQQAVVNFYVNNKAARVPDVATQFNLKPTQVSAILALHGVPVRRGNGNLTDEARAKGAVTRSQKALLRHLVSMVEEHGEDVVRATLDNAIAIVNSQSAEEGNE